MTISSAKRSDYICIYSGEGSSADCVDATQKSLIKMLGSDGQRRVIKVPHPQDFSSKCLQNGNTLLVPGGYTPVIKKILGSFGQDKISDFIRNKKGSYIGICAGAYLVSGIGWECSFSTRLFSLSKSIFHELSTASPYDGGKGVRAVDVVDTRTERSLKLVWWLGGAYESPVEGSEEIVAYYNAKASQKVAVLKPQSNVLLCNLHPEFQISGELGCLDLSPQEKSTLSSGGDVADWFERQLISIGVKESAEKPGEVFNSLPPLLNFDEQISNSLKSSLFVARVLSDTDTTLSSSAMLGYLQSCAPKMTPNIFQAPWTWTVQDFTGGAVSGVALQTLKSSNLAKHQKGTEEQKENKNGA